MKLLGAPLLSAILLITVLAGCLAVDPDPDEDETQDDSVPGLTSVHERAELPFDMTDDWSWTLDEGPFEMLPVESVFVQVDLPVDQLGGAAIDDAYVHMGIFRPDVPNGTKVPVIADIGPYYGDGDVAATQPANRLGGFLIENFVQHGYAVAQVSVFGSGQSTHCMDLMGPAEQTGIDAAVSFLGDADWSNGNVGLIGRSYDGSTPWQAAMFGNEALKTIVPISGLIGMHELMWRNGTAETRGPIMHNVVYGQFGMDFEGDKNPVNYFCRDYLLGPAQGAGAVVTGDWVAPQANDYWSSRYFLDRALENYNGSVYFIHGLQDWNVDPHMAFPTHHKLEDAGLEVKGLYGQWAHDYPDRPDDHEFVRWDWAQDLLEWFDHYLMETGPKPALHTEVQDFDGEWRLEDSYPPRDVEWQVLEFGSDIEQVSGDGLVYPEVEPNVYEFGPFEEDVRLAGMPRLHMSVTPSGPGGQLYAYMKDKTDDRRLGHAIMDLRFHEGGNEATPVVPGMAITALMEFQALDVIIPAGNIVELQILDTGRDYLNSAVSSPVVLDESSASVLKLPVKHTTPDQFFSPPFPEEEADEEE